jgi:threonyl-tRNA synthetase
MNKNNQASPDQEAQNASNSGAQSQNIEHIRHSLAHLLATATLELFPDTILTIGPAVDDGFYYDMDFQKPLVESDLKDIEEKMRDTLKKWSKLPDNERGFRHKEVSVDEARVLFANNPYKLELIEDIAKKGEAITLYTCGHSTATSAQPAHPKNHIPEFTDLCRGGHVDDFSMIDPKSFKLTRIAGAYWRGDEKNKMLTRVYGIAFGSKDELDAYITMQEEAKKRDHRKLGKDLDLFVFSDTVGKGLPLWTERGAAVRRELERFITDEELKRNYKHVYTPDIAKIELYKKSGHYPYYKDSMYSPIDIDDEQFMLRPMTCPHHFELYTSKPRTYKELPMRIAELAKLYRYEQSGELSGLIRVRSFCLADAHIICANPTQAAEEVNQALDLIEHIAGVFGLKMGVNYSYRLSLGDRSDESKYFKDDNAWDEAEEKLRQVLISRKADFIEANQEAAFYGPKIDVQMKDVRGKENTAFTVQYDFVMPKRFDLKYKDRDGVEKEALVIHRSSIGAIERVVGVLIEHFAGAFPLWMSPVQTKIVPIGERQFEYAQEVQATLRAAGIRSEVDLSGDSLGKKIRNAKTEKVPYVLVIGDKEVETKTVTIESRTGNEGAVSVESLLERLRSEIVNRVL